MVTYLLWSGTDTCNDLYLVTIECFFCRGFKAYLKGAPNYNFTMYKQLVNEITTTFRNISNDILAIGQLLLTNNRKELADSVRKIQELEERKLKCVRHH